MTRTLDALDALESESIHIFREVAGEFDRPVILFSGGKDSTLLVHLAVKAFAPAPVPFPLLHVDTGHNYPEVIDFRDRLVERLGLRLEVAHVQDWIDDGRLVERPDGTRNPLQTVPLLDSINEHRFDAVFGGGRRDEERARAKERIISLRDAFGRWDPRTQRPELWNLYNGRHAPGEHVRVFPISNWTELDVWRYIQRENVELPSIYYSHERPVFRRDGMWLAEGPWGGPRGNETHGDEDRALPDGRRRLVHRRRRVHGDDAGRDHRRGHGVAADRARGDPGGRPAQRGRDGRPQAGGLLLMAEVSTAAGTAPEAITPKADPAGRGAHHVRDLLRFATAGSVDDGKSTLVGRLLYDTKSVLADQIEAVQRASVDKGLATPDLSLLVDGLRAEREQGITIDVAYRYFSTPRREFVLADTPGHVQYTRNTVTGASTAELAVLLVDARNGIVEQTRRHAAVLALLRVPRLVLAINKIDIVDYDEETLTAIAKDFAALARSLGFPDEAVVTIPVSALVGDNVVERSERTPWYDGPTLLGHLESVPVIGPRGGGAVPDAGAVRDPAPEEFGRNGRAARLPRLRRSGRIGHRRAGRRGRRAARGPPHDRRQRRHRRRTAGVGRRGPERDGAAGRRHRHLPRRPARRRVAPRRG